MPILPVRHLPDPILREHTRRIRTNGASLGRFVDDMFETMYAEHGVGLAANQVGSLLRIAVIEIPPERLESDESSDGTSAEADEQDTELTAEPERYVLINPEIVRRVGEREVDEGCLSIPGWRGRLTRSERVTARALDLNGREFRIRAHGLLAQALEHETDHLNGVAYVDRMDRIEDLWNMEELEEGSEEGKTASPREPVWRMRKPAPSVVRRG
jgi:peptide deformylase